MAFSGKLLNLWDLSLNTPAPTLALNRGGPVACIGGPVAFQETGFQEAGFQETGLLQISW